MAPPQQVFQGHPERVAEKRHQDVSLHPRFELMEQGPDRQLTLQRPEGGFGFGELDVFRPKLFGRFAFEIGAQQIGAFARRARRSSTSFQ